MVKFSKCNVFGIKSLWLSNVHLMWYRKWQALRPTGKKRYEQIDRLTEIKPLSQDPAEGESAERFTFLPGPLSPTTTSLCKMVRQLLASISSKCISKHIQSSTRPHTNSRIRHTCKIHWLSFCVDFYVREKLGRSSEIWHKVLHHNKNL